MAARLSRIVGFVPIVDVQKCLAIQDRFFLVRRWPSGIPSARAFCLRAPGVRLSALELVLTRVLSFECCLSSLTSARVQSRRTTRFVLAIVLAINFLLFYSQPLIAQLFWPARASIRLSNRPPLTLRRPGIKSTFGGGGTITLGAACN